MIPLAVLTTYHMQQMSAMRKKSFTAFHRILNPFVSVERQKTEQRNFLGVEKMSLENLTCYFVEGTLDILGVERFEGFEER